MFGDDIASLSKLLETGSETTKTSQTSRTSASALAPATVVQPAKASTQPAKSIPASFSSQKDIWDVSEATEKVPDTRKRPKFDILYKQSVGAEDVYLGMSGKTPASFHCDCMVIKIELPGEKLADIELNLTEDEITVASSNFHLNTYLPKKIHSKQGKAQWDSVKGKLSVTVPLIKDDLFP